MDVGSLLVHDCGILGVSIRPSSISNPDSGQGFLATQNFAKREVVGHYYGLLFYMHLEVHNLTNGVVSEVFKAVSTEDF